ncbi:hypothetical protein BU26DRAFT_76960 [Trematosphaeria pertusa]|uniref:Tse2 ADP-ribosyltransferase toxin domain-containing protein n=1 Tax=Trematosphaeria pertusa TaxID=390896 RepID=A0A6A6I491_9PLEO|nr:uncharacterized protein BU26DRAFT_76960 [Trematosphaeria pertusa]KAF2245107.1 hypothetical protein BU26DRAFT_76960 [Trematosphaeria pertusa]
MLIRLSRKVASGVNVERSRLVNWRSKRDFSLISIHSSFPASLLRLNAGAKSNLFDYQDQASIEYQSPRDGVRISERGVIYPAVFTNLPSVSNGAALMPNTFMMQEIIRTAVDQYVDDQENGISVERPVVFTIPKGTTIPRTLVLLREHTSRFSLQPSGPTALDALNNILDEFYLKYAEKQTAEEWLDNHDFASAVADDAEILWTSR